MLTASFRFHLTIDTLAVRLYTSSLPRRVRDFHPLERAHGAQTKNGESLFCFRHSLFPSSVKRALSAVSVIICGSVVIIVIAGQIIHTVLHSVDDILSSLTDTVYHVVHNIAVSVVISCAVVIHRTVIV